ncbi:MAG: metallophosphoesterase [Elusimicrobiota bacterium]|jgi:Icc-related predicted phosphoesterase|nr:metallophosphoesterase [Elusimicrobiota bacterium]
MKILAVSDKEDNHLKHIIENHPEKLKAVDYVFSCGDLQKDYIEFIVDGLKKKMYFVCGNHFASQFYESLSPQEFCNKVYHGKGIKNHCGSTDVHGNIEIIENYILVGFGGSMRYSLGDFQLNDVEMEKLVEKTCRTIRRIKLLDFIFFRKRKKIIVISHAPVNGIFDGIDLCHRGFGAFRKFIFKAKPLLWLHGHIHTEDRRNTNKQILDETLIVNVCFAKIIEIENELITVKNVYDETQKA